MRAILVPVAGRPECERALPIAFDLAGRIGASVTGCHMRPHRYADSGYGPDSAVSSWKVSPLTVTPVLQKRLLAPEPSLSQKKMSMSVTRLGV